MINRSNLQDLLDNCIELMNVTINFDGGADNNAALAANRAKLNDAVRRVVIANELYNKVIISVCGLQGAGKTTLMQTFYGIDPDKMAVTFGRGEKVPVLITEYPDCNEPEMYSMELIQKDGSYSTCSFRIESEEEFKKKATNFNDDSSTVMYLEMRVPYKYTNDSSVSFMLLPGFENQRSYWQSLVEFAVKSSDASIFVLSENMYAAEINEMYLSKVRETFNNNLIYALSWSDTASDKNDELKENIANKLGIGKNERDRIVCTGTFSSEADNDIWRNELKAAIEKYANVGSNAVEKSTQYMRSLIEETILPAIQGVRNIVFLNNVQGNNPNDDILKEFDRAKNKYRKMYENCIDEYFKPAKSKCLDRLDKIFTDKNFAKNNNINLGALSKIRRAIFGSDISNIVTAKRIVDVSLRDDDDPRNYAYVGAFFNAVNYTMNNIVNSKPQITRLLSVNKPTAAKQGANSSVPVLADKSADILEDIKTLVTSDGSGQKLIKQTGELKKTIRSIAELGTYYSGVTTLSKMCAENLCVSEFNVETPCTALAEIKSGPTTLQKLTFGTAGITGVDLVADGSINAIPKIATALEVTTGTVAIAAAAIAAVAAGVSIASDVSKNTRGDYLSCQKSVLSAFDEAKSEYLKKYDEGMERLRDTIAENISDMNPNKQLAASLNAKVMLNRIGDNIDTIYREVNKANEQLPAVLK